jgi:hypothetical protein
MTTHRQYFDLGAKWARQHATIENLAQLRDNAALTDAILSETDAIGAPELATLLATVFDLLDSQALWMIEQQFARNPDNALCQTYNRGEVAEFLAGAESAIWELKSQPS